MRFQLDFEDEPDDEDVSEAGSEEKETDSSDEHFEDAMENLKINEA